MTTLKSRDSLEYAIMAVCHLWAGSRSKDPSTKVGACIYDPHSGGLFLGYNGFPAGVPDLEDAWKARSADPDKALHLTKYDLVIHAETNAVRKALIAGVDLRQAMLICTHIPCSHCMKDVVVANGIKTVIYEAGGYPSRKAREDYVVKALAGAGGVKLSPISDYFKARNEALERLPGWGATHAAAPPAAQSQGSPRPLFGVGECPACKVRRAWRLEPGVATRLALISTDIFVDVDGGTMASAAGNCPKCQVMIPLQSLSEEIDG